MANTEINAVLTGTPDNDTLTGTSTPELLIGGKGNDLLIGGGGQDTFRIEINDGQDTVQADGDDVLVLGEGYILGELQVAQDATNALTVSRRLAPLHSVHIQGSEPLDSLQIRLYDGLTLSGSQLRQIANPSLQANLSGDTRDNMLVGNADANTLSGLEGNDTLLGAQGNDVLQGGLGNDVLATGEGADTVYFNAGDGQDTLYLDDQDTLIFGPGILQSAMRLPPLYGGEKFFEITFDGSTDKVTLARPGNWQGLRIYFDHSGYTEGKLLLIEAENRTPRQLTGSDSADTLMGAMNNDTIDGRGGNDSIYANAGSDLVSGGTGNDQIDTTNFGGDGQDTIRFAAGDGQDTLKVDANDVLELGPGISSAGVTMSLAADIRKIQLHLGSGSDQLTFDRLALPDQFRIQFSDGRSLLGADLKQYVNGPLNTSGTDGDDFIVGSRSSDVLQAGIGNDLLLGLEGDDFIDAGQGVDEVSGGAGADTISVQGDGRVLIHLDNADSVWCDAFRSDRIEFAPLQTSDQSLTFRGIGHDREVTLTDLGQWDQATFEFADGMQWTGADLIQMAKDVNPLLLQGSAQADLLSGKNGADTLLGGGGNDTLNGGLANDQLAGGLGNDEITGGDGADTVYFNAGDGQDLVHADGLDTLVLGAGLTRSSLQLSQLPTTGGSELSLGFAGRTDRITLDQLGSWDSLTVQFADGTRTTGAALIQEARVQPLTLKGTSGKDMLTGQSKADNLSGLAGNDTLIGNQGNDTLIGGSGADTYRFKRGDGQDTVIENDLNILSRDVLAFGDVAANQLWFTRSGQSLVVSVIGTQDRVTVQDWFKGSAYRVEAFTSSDGRSLSSSKVNSLVSAMAKFSPPAEGTTTLPTATAKALQPVLASSWV